MRTRLLAGLVVAAAVFSVTACSGSSAAQQRTLAKEFPAIKAAVLTATSVKMAGTLAQGGLQLTLDVNLARSGDVYGLLGENGHRYWVLKTGGIVYYRLTRAYLRLNNVPAARCATLCGKWFETLPGTANVNLTMRALINALFAGPFRRADILLVATTQQGQRAWVARRGKYALYIARSGKPYLLSLSMDGQVVTFSDWNTATLPGRPAKNQIVTVAQLARAERSS